MGMSNLTNTKQNSSFSQPTLALDSPISSVGATTPLLYLKFWKSSLLHLHHHFHSLFNWSADILD